MISLQILHLSKRFGETVALDDVTIEIGPGEIFFLLGPSGSGKTTLLRCIAGFHVPESGRILFGTEEVTHLPPHRRNAGMMFQSYALWPHMTVAKNVAFGLEERRVSAAETAKRIGEALESVRMAAYGERRIHQLSGGQQQRVALARALVIRPRCLLLDEPLSNLDTKLRLEMRLEIRRVCKEFGLTAVYVTHDQKEALSIADRMAILENGQVRQSGRPAEIYRHPQSKFVADFMGETNFIDGQVASSENGTMRIETALGPFTAKLDPERWRPQSGTRCLLSIRPESWTIRTTPDAQNSVSGRIAERLYLGEMAQYQFVAGAQKLKIFELNPRFVEVSDERQLFASVAPEDVIALPA